jgi:hypothetical protein
MAENLGESRGHSADATRTVMAEGILLFRFTLAFSLRAGRKIDRVREITRRTTNNVRQINDLEYWHPPPSGSMLREANPPLRERAGRQ